MIIVNKIEVNIPAGATSYVRLASTHMIIAIETGVDILVGRYELRSSYQHSGDYREQETC